MKDSIGKLLIAFTCRRDSTCDRQWYIGQWPFRFREMLRKGVICGHPLRLNYYITFMQLYTCMIIIIINLEFSIVLIGCSIKIVRGDRVMRYLLHLSFRKSKNPCLMMCSVHWLRDWTINIRKKSSKLTKAVLLFPIPIAAKSKSLNHPLFDIFYQDIGRLHFESPQQKNWTRRDCTLFN